MIIKGAEILTDKFIFEKKDILFDEKIKRIGSNIDGDDVYLYDNCFVIPGLIDIHTHGAVDVDAMDEHVDFRKWKDFLLMQGITTFFPSTVTATDEEILRAVKNLEESDGINLEGPFISYEKRGAHDEKKIKAVDLSLLEKIKDKVKITTVAPEMWDNSDKISKITDMGIKVSIGHTTIDYEGAKKAFFSGATHITHTFNAMPALLHRSPGLIGAAFENDNIFCEVISDGYHLHPSVVRLIYKSVGADRMILISDSMRATGLSDGNYTLGGLEVSVKNGRATLKDGTIAGSTSTLYQMVKNAVSFGLPIEDAVKSATLTPARAVGLSDSRGSLTEGKLADICVIDKNMNIIAVFSEGKKVAP